MGGGALLDNPKDEAARMVLLMGGKDKVVSAAKSALDKKEFFWGAQVIQYVYLLEPENKEVRNLKAELLRQMAYRTTGSIARAFLMTEALALEGKVNYPKLMPPGVEIIAALPETFVNFFRVRIDPKKSENTDKVVEFVFTDKGNHAVALHVRRGIAEYIPVPADYFRESDFVLNLDSETWVGLYLSEMSLKDREPRPRSYQYVAMYNVNNKFALKQGGWNTVDADTQLKDHTMREIARPNNDTLYISALLDLRKDPVILEMPAFDSDYVSLMVTGYDHYVNVPMATRLGDFKKPEKMLFYTERTEGYDGEPVEGVDRIFEAPATSSRRSCESCPMPRIRSDSNASSDRWSR
jgi:hypothetical protein